METRIFEHTDAAGKTYRIERFENRVALSVFESNRQIKKNCEGCRNHAVNLSCPPHSPFFPEYVRGSNEASVICYRVSLGGFPGPVREACHTAFTVVRSLLLAELLKSREAENIVAGSGACLVCNLCAGESGSTECRIREKRIYSLESLGVNVVALSEKAFDLKLDWSDDATTARYVSAIGAVFR